jgi:hypothetical protein
VRVEIVNPEPPIGQQFIIRRYLRDVLARAPFEGDAWDSCVSAFLEPPGHPLLARHGTTQAPASFFLNLYVTREPTYPPDGEGRWGEAELRHRLAELGEQRVTLLIATDQSRSWAIYLSEALDEVLAFHGRTLPEPRFSWEDDARDLEAATLIRHHTIAPSGARVVRLNNSNPPTPAIELIDDAGHRYMVKFTGFRRLRAASPENNEITRVEEVRAPSGRTWFVFEPAQQNRGRKLAIQAESATWTETT